jgi:Fe-S oxidoreductase
VTDLRRAAELCEFCPKMCRFSCPVSEAAKREAFTPWGKVSLAVLAGRDPHPSAAEAFGACTGCLRCQFYCAHANDVPAVLYAARATAIRAGSAPAPWSAVATRMAAAGHAESADLAAVHAAIAADEARASSRPAADQVPAPLLFAGCDALAAGGLLVRQMLAVARALGAPLSLAPPAALCCGLKLAEAGHPELFGAHAARVKAAVTTPPRPQRERPARLRRAPGPRAVHLVFLSPACARAARERWSPLPAGSRVEHATSYLARALSARSELRERPPLPGAVTWHDPCELARGLSELTAPRALLAAAVEEVREPARCGADASCCGAGGLLPRTLPEVAAAIAAERRAELEACGAPAVTASPACSASLGAEDVISVLARWLAV